MIDSSTPDYERRRLFYKKNAATKRRGVDELTMTMPQASAGS
jgi:hypothetical protein